MQIGDTMYYHGLEDYPVKVVEIMGSKVRVEVTDPALATPVLTWYDRGCLTSTTGSGDA